MSFTQLKFWSQSLDDLTPDHMAHGDNLLGEGDSEERRALVNEVYEIATEKNMRASWSDDIRVYSKASRFVVEIFSKQLDKVGRRLPIIVLSVLPGDFSDEWLSNLEKALITFSKKIKRTIKEENIEAMKELLKELSHQEKQKKEIYICLGVLIGITVIGVLWIFFKKSG